MVGKKFRLAKPHISNKAYAEIKKVFSSGNLVQGKNVDLFEKKLADYLGADFAIVVSSGTAALHISLLAMGVGPGDDVVIPAYSFVATANVVEVLKANCIFVDINADDFCINAELIEEAVTPRTKIIMPVHEFGQAADMTKIMKVASEKNLDVVEDACCALGTEYNAKKVGTFGDLGCFSFHPRKTITTGEGGFIVTNNPDLAQSLKSLRNHGLIRGDLSFDILSPGLNYRMNDFQAVLGLDQFDSFYKILEYKDYQTSLYNSLLSDVEELTIPKTFVDRKSSFQTYHIVVENGRRDSLRGYLSEKGIESNIGAYAIPLLSYYKKKYNIPKSRIPQTVAAYEKGLALPIGTHLLDSDIKKICTIIKEFFAKPEF